MLPSAAESSHYSPKLEEVPPFLQMPQVVGSFCMIIFCGYLTKITPDYVTAFLFTL